MFRNRRPWVAALLFAAVLGAVAAVGGGWLALGRVDPLLAVPGAGWAALAWRLASGPDVALKLSRLLPPWIAAGLWLAAVGGWRAPGQWLAALVALAVALWLAWRVARAVAGRARVWRIAAPVALALAWQWAGWPLVGQAYALRFADDPPRLLLMTALPLDGAQAIAQRLHGPDRRAPMLVLLDRASRLRRIDRLDSATLTPGDTLLLAHPRALAPAELVALDGWVRDGGRAVILADGLLSWHPAYPLGDARNPPVTSLLTPLLTHWGLRLDAPPGLASRVERVNDAGERLALLSAGRFVREGGTCALSAQGRIARCAIGRGRAVLVADADWLQAALWAGPGAADPFNARRWDAGNALWLLDRLSESNRGFAPAIAARPLWTGDSAP
jgi:hypothetical protein